MTTIEELTEDDYTTAVEAAVELVRAKHPNLDLRSGTALRALMIEPGAMLDAAQKDVVNRLRTAMSLEAMSREDSVPRDDAEAVLSNFGISLGGGTKATGVVRVNVTSSTDITVRAGVTFTTEDSVEFVTTATVTASSDPADGETELISSSDGKYYFTIPVEAVEVGASGNILQGCALSCSTILGSYYSSEAFSDFSGGEDGETVASAVARIPSALAYRGMTNTLSVQAQLAASLSDASILKAVSCVGYRSRAQLRDKHNPLGVAVGGRVDVYARLFDIPGTESFIATGTLVSTTEGNVPAEWVGLSGVYKVQIPEYPGFYAVKAVGPAEQSNSQGSLQNALIRDTVDGATTDHDFKVYAGHHEETAWSKYQDGYILVHNDTDSSSESQPETVDFKVELYWTDGISALQGMVDSDEVSNVAADYVVRSPAICLVDVVTSVRLKSGVSVSGDTLSERVAAYINGRSFVPRITRSEIANILLQNGAESVDLSEGGMQLSGRVCGADGKWYYIGGDSLDVSAVGDERTMLTSGTVVFAAEQGAVQVSIVK